MASADHEWDNCPHRAATINLEDVRLAKPNHYYHDSLGCPFECPDDHNHPFRRKE